MLKLSWRRRPASSARNCEQQHRYEQQGEPPARAAAAQLDHEHDQRQADDDVPEGRLREAAAPVQELVVEDDVVERDRERGGGERDVDPVEAPAPGTGSGGEERDREGDRDEDRDIEVEIRGKGARPVPKP